MTTRAFNDSRADRIASRQILVVTHAVLVSLEVAADCRDLLREFAFQFLQARPHLQAVDDTFYFAGQKFPQSLATERLTLFRM